MTKNHMPNRCAPNRFRLLQFDTTSAARGARMCRSQTRRPGRRSALILLVTGLALTVPQAILAQGQYVSNMASQAQVFRDQALRAQGMATEETQAESGGFFTTRRTLGVAFLAGSALLAGKGLDFNDEADEFYGSYESATDPAEIEKFYQRTTNRDVKSQVTWALAAAFGITGLRLALTGDEPATARQSSGTNSSVTTRAAQPYLTLTPAVTPRVVGLRLQRHFF